MATATKKKTNKKLRKSVDREGHRKPTKQRGSKAKIPTKGPASTGEGTVIQASLRAIARAQKEMEANAPLKRIYDQLRRMVMRAAKSEHKVRYAIGEKVNTVIKAKKEKYGNDAVGTLAVLLGYEKTALYDYARVAERWSENDVTSILKRKTPTTLFFSHLIALAKVNSEKRRYPLLERAIAEGLSVRQLQLAIDNTGVSEDTRDEPPEVRSFRAAITAWKGERVAVRGRTNRLLEQAKSKPTKAVLLLMSRSAEGQRAVAKEYENCASELEKAQKLLDPGQSAKKTFRTSGKSA